MQGLMVFFVGVLCLLSPLMDMIIKLGLSEVLHAEPEDLLINYTTKLSIEQMTTLQGLVMSGQLLIIGSFFF